MPESSAASYREVARRLQETLSSLRQQPLPPEQLEALAKHLILLLQWNAKINLTSVRDEMSILKRHFSESIQCARLLPSGMKTLLDYGSGGGFPGIACAVCRPELEVMLAETQLKKVAFLRETVRVLGLNTRVHHGRVQEMDADIRFDLVTLRAVDRMQEACAAAFDRVRPGGWMAVLSSVQRLEALISALPEMDWGQPDPLAGSDHGVMLLGRRPLNQV